MVFLKKPYHPRLPVPTQEKDPHEAASQPVGVSTGEAPESENPADWIMDIIAREAQVRGRGTWVWVARPLSPNTSRHT